MDTSSNGTGSAVACPVCTLYLREGISLQRHLDTHPKEQVIDALIKASSSNSSNAQQSQLSSSSSAASSSVQTTPNTSQVAQNTHLSAQSPYPIGPIFECPPIGTMMPPQFASFSYQQFVNNGTMMIPQYAMAPQANQMMQMLYNPYNMYQQQQIPTVQMISPVTAMPSTAKIRPIVTMAGETSSRTAITVSVNNSEPKQILPEILPECEQESDQALSDINLSVSSSSLNRETPTEQNNSEGGIIQMGHTRDEPCASSTPKTHSVQNEYNSIPNTLAITCNMADITDDKVESVLPDIDDPKSPEVVTTDVQCKTIHYESPEIQDYVHRYDDDSDGNDKIIVPEVSEMVMENETIEIIDNEKVPQTEEIKEGEEDTSEVQSTQSMIKEPAQPEVEQLERLLITIMENEFNNVPQKGTNFEEDQKEKESTHEILSSEEAEVIIEETSSNTHEDKNSCKLNIEINVNENSDIDNRESKSSFDVYQYKNSLSAPVSPIPPKKPRRTYSLHSEVGSNDNLSCYGIGFDANTLQDVDDDDDEKNEVEDNFDRTDMEIEEIPSPHTPFTKYGESTDNLRSHTPLSASSGISVLRVRKDLSKPCSPASVHSFCHMDTNDMSHDEEESNIDLDVTPEKDPIDCSTPSPDEKNDKSEIFLSENEKKMEGDSAYQSVIIKHMSSFSKIHSEHPEQSTLVDESYNVPSTSNNHVNLSECSDVASSSDSKGFNSSKSITQKQSVEFLSLNEDAHAGPMNVFEFDGLQILVPSTFISDSSQKAVSATSQQSMASSEGGVGVDEEVKSINMRADETMPPRGELSEQESNGCTEQSAWQLYAGQESSRMSTSYDLMARESWEESEGSDNEIGGPLLDSRSLATHFTSSLFLDRDRKTPTKRTFKCYHCPEVFDCPKERRVHSTTTHKEAGPSNSTESTEQPEVKDIKVLDGRMNVFEDIFVPALHVQQVYHQQPLLHQLQPPQLLDLPTKVESDQKSEALVIPSNIEVICALCNQRFSSEKSLQLHHRRVHITETVKRIRESMKCQICQEEFPSVISFNAHLKVHPLECSQCGKYFYRRQNFKLHIKRHLGIKPFPCTVCDKAFLTKQKLDEHTNGHTGNAPVKCNLCNETFRRYSNLTQHKNRHHLNIKKKLKDYICHCGEIFHTKKKLAWHKETHDEKPKACSYCNERFIHMASLTRHMRRAHNKRFVPNTQRESENVECPICKCIYLRSSLAVHMRVHNGEKPYECQVCSKAFSTKWNLQLHKWTHAARSTKPFKCNQCSGAFYRHSDYTAHMNSHKNVRPYTCNYCGAQFIRKYNCLRHVKEHEEKKAYTCDVCSKTFHRSYYLKEHLRVHSGARPYTCHICGKSSGTKSNHNKHVRIHHAREPVNTEN